MSSVPMIDRYRAWFAHEVRAHAAVVRSLEGVPGPGRPSPAFARAVAILGHVAAARGVWLGRLGVGGGESWSSGAVDLATVAQKLDRVHRRWTDYLAGLDDADLARLVAYQSSDAGRFTSRLEDILDQLHGHSWYHRGQVAMLVREAGGEPAATDLIYQTRLAIEGEAAGHPGG